MDAGELVGRYPRLFHMASDGSWPSICEHGLLSTTALLDLFDYDGIARAAIESARRPDLVPIEHDLYGSATIRDNKPLSESKLAMCLLDGLKPADWYRMLNRRVFFWLTAQRVQTLLSARAYRTSPQTVLILDTKALVEVYVQAVTLSPINSGSTAYRALPRGTGTFQSIEDYDYAIRRKRRGPRDAIAELAVDYRVEEVERFVMRVERRYPNGDCEVLWEPRTGS